MSDAFVERMLAENTLASKTEHIASAAGSAIIGNNPYNWAKEPEEIADSIQRVKEFEAWYLDSTNFEDLGVEDDETRRRLIFLQSSGKLSAEEVESINSTFGWQL